MYKYIYVYMISVLGLGSIVNAQHTGEAEIIFSDAALYNIDCILSTGNGFALNENMDRDNSLNSVVAITGGGLMSTDKGVNYFNNCGSPCLPDIGSALYHINIEGLIFYFDNRHCDNWPYNAVGGTPDLTINTLEETFQFNQWDGDPIWYNITPGMIIYISWAWVDEQIYMSGDISQFSNTNNYECYESNITFSMKYGDEQLSGIFDFPVESESVQSGESISLVRSDFTNAVSERYVTDSNNNTTTHNYWERSGSPKTLIYPYQPDIPEEVISRYKTTDNSTLSTSTTTIPISIQDPWWVDGNGSQSSYFHELLNQGYQIFPNEGDELYPDTWAYAVSVPYAEYTIGQSHYVFSGWEVLNAMIAPYPGEETNELKRKVLFINNYAVVKAHYIDINAVEGNIFNEFTLSGNRDIVGHLSVESTGDVLFEFWDWIGIGNNFLINEGDTINVWWSQIEDPQENPITHPHLYDVEPIEDCVMIFV